MIENKANLTIVKELTERFRTGYFSREHSFNHFQFGIDEVLEKIMDSRSK